MSVFALQAPDAADRGTELPPDANWPQTLAELMEVLRATYRRVGRSDGEALMLAEHGVLAIGQHLGGRSTYLPRGDALIRAVRNRRIFCEWRGNNREELMARYKITQRRLEQIVAEQSAIHIRRIQPDLFALDSA